MNNSRNSVQNQTFAVDLTRYNKNTLSTVHNGCCECFYKHLLSYIESNNTRNYSKKIANESDKR